LIGSFVTETIGSRAARQSDDAVSRAIDTNPARWAADPWDRFAQRYWDGARWTEHVATQAGGRGSLDPPPLVQMRTEPTGPTPHSAVGQLDASEPEGSPGGGSGWATHEPNGNGHANVAPGWRPDPAGRHAQRYWDGDQWTEFVAPVGGGAPASDPIPVDEILTP
jgi:hypothetical protein